MGLMSITALEYQNENIYLFSFFFWFTGAGIASYAVLLMMMMMMAMIIMMTTIMVAMMKHIHTLPLHLSDRDRIHRFGSDKQACAGRGGGIK